MLSLICYVILILARSLEAATIQEERDSTYDFLIIGGGVSGLTVADRLTEAPDVSVLVLEYGPFDGQEASVLVPGLLNLTASPYLFNLSSTPQKGLNDTVFSVTAGAVVGGSSAVNGMLFDRGAAVDYDGWEALGNPGWDWKGLLPYFKKERIISETFTPPQDDLAREFTIQFDPSVHGFNGPVQSSYPVFQWNMIKNFFRAWHNIGVETPQDPHAGIKAGVFWDPSTLDPKDETRSYARIAHYERVKERPNYHIRANAAVQKITFNKTRAIGVEYIDRLTGQVHKVNANKEVISAAGALHSPQILQLSGVGPNELLDKLQISPVVPLPGVGSNFQDHPTVYAILSFQNKSVPNIDMLSSNSTYATEQLALYWAERRGPYTIVNHGGNTVSFLPLPNITDAYESIISLALNQSVDSLYPSVRNLAVLAGYEAQRKLAIGLYDSFTTSVQETAWNSDPVFPITLTKPLSRGSVLINSTSILSPPLIDFGTFTEPSDIEILVAALRVNRKLWADPAMQELGPTELVPGKDLTADEELRQALKGLAQPTYYHYCGTCAMMPERLGGVVGPDLRVHGTEGLSVVDASVMPMIPSSHPVATVYAVAEKAADLIKARHGIC